MEALGAIDHLFDSAIVRLDQLRIDGKQTELASVGEENERAARQKVPIEVESFHLAPGLVPVVLPVEGGLDQKYD